MRLVSHPNVVDLKAFFYSNGDKVEPLSWFFDTAHSYRRCRRMKCTSILCSNMYLKPSTVQAVIMQSSGSPCPCYKSNCICTNSYVPSRTFTLSASAIATSSHRTYCSTLPRAFSSSAILVQPRSWSQTNQTSATFAQDITEHRSSSLALQITRPTSVSCAVPPFIEHVRLEAKICISSQISGRQGVSWLS
jgi:hypothetical protein